MKKIRKILVKQLALLAEQSKDCDTSELIALTNEMQGICFELRQRPLKSKKGDFDGNIRFKTKIDNSELDKTVKKLKKAAKLAKKLSL